MLGAERAWEETCAVLEGKGAINMLEPATLGFSYEGEMKTFPGEEKAERLDRSTSPSRSHSDKELLKSVKKI